MEQQVHERASASPITDPGNALTLERYAEILAHTVYFGVALKAEVLERFHVDRPAWEAADAKWTKALVDEALAEDCPATRAFSASFAPALKRLKADKPALASIGVAPGGTLPAQADAPSPPAPAPPTPSYLPIDAPAPLVEPPPAFSRAPLRQDTSVSVWARGEAPVALHTPPEGAGAEQRRPSSLPIDYASLVPEGMRHFQSIHATQPAEQAPSGPALPFRPDARPTLEKEGPRLDTAPTARPEGARGPKVGAETAPSIDRGAGAASLPFVSPAKPSASVDVPSLSLEQYASLCVELDRGGPVQETLSRYHLTAEQRARLDAHWQKRMADDPQVWLAWTHACNAYRAWLSQSGVGRR